MRKVLWTAGKTGKRGGVRVIYFNMDEEGVIHLIFIYRKSQKENVTPNELKQFIDEV